MNDDNDNHPALGDYPQQQQELAAEAATRLQDMAARMRAFMTAHAVAQAFLSVGVDAAGRSMTREQLAAWLAGIAEELGDEQKHPRAH